MKSRILLTGATGFLGQHLLPALCKNNYILSVGRTNPVSELGERALIPGISAETDWTDVLDEIDVVIHAAARAHAMTDESEDPLTAYRSINVAGTQNLAEQAASAGVKRFIYISSVKVNGESTTGTEPFGESDTPMPEDPYGVSKREAEDCLRTIAEDTDMDIVMIRPPLVYGAGVKGNFNSLLKLTNTGLPLPFGAIHNQRSMIYVGNLVDFIKRCISHPAAANETFLVSDCDDRSLSSRLLLMRRSMGRPARIFPVPIFLFRIAGAVTGKSDVIKRLVGDLQVDTTKAQKLLDWQPAFSVEDGIKATVKYFLKSEK